jgi:hypothetical protein
MSETIDDAVCDLMRRFGPDGHVDGHEEITRYIESLLTAEREGCVTAAETVAAGIAEDEGINVEIVAEVVAAIRARR